MEVTKIIKKISDIEVFPWYIDRKLIIVVGKKVSVLIFNKTKVIIAGEGVSLLFSSCNSWKALRPSGVAAAPSPNIFATRFEQIYSIQSESLSILGNKKARGFFNNLVIFLIKPDAIAIWKIPFQNKIKRASFKKIWNASVAELIMILPNSSVKVI